MSESKSIKTRYERYDVEQICKAFIRLINAPLVEDRENATNKKEIKRRERRATPTARDNRLKYGSNGVQTNVTI
jgi:hypothetical protein